MFFFFNDTATTEIYTLSLHDALPICDVVVVQLSLNGNHRGDLPMGLGTLPATGKEVHVPCVDVFHLEDGKLSAFDCHYAGTIMLAQLGVLGNLEASLKK